MKKHDLVPCCLDIASVLQLHAFLFMWDFEASHEKENESTGNTVTLIMTKGKIKGHFPKKDKV